MAARRSKRGRRNRGRFGFLYKLLSMAALLAAIVVGCVVFFRVGEIRVEGQARYTAGQIVEAAGAEEGENLFALNKMRMAKQIISRLPYVDTVAISRLLPDTLVIRVTECVPMAVIQGDGAWWVLDKGSKLLERTDFAGAAAYPQVTGLSAMAPAVGMKLTVAEEGQRKLDSLVKLMQALDKYQVGDQAESFDLSASNVILMKYGGRFTVKMPYVTAFDRAVRTVAAAVEQLPENATGVLDLTLDEPHLIPYSS